jgi:hypothetical protein
VQLPSAEAALDPDGLSVAHALAQALSEHDSTHWS